MDGTRKYHPEWGNLVTKENTQYTLTDKWILAPMLRIPKMQYTDHMKLKKDDQSMGASVLPRRGTKYSLEEIRRKNPGNRDWRKGQTRLPHLDIHPIYSHQTQTLLQMPRNAGAWYSCLLRGSARAWRIQSQTLPANHWPENRVSNGGGRERTEGAKGVWNPIGKGTVSTNQTHYPQSSEGLTQLNSTYGATHVSATYVAEDGLVRHQSEEKLLVLWRFDDPV